MGFRAHDLAAAAPVPRPMIGWEETACLLCGRRHWSHVVEAPDTSAGAGLWFAVVQCRDCGLCFTNPRPDRASIGQFYGPGYGPHVPRHGAKRLARRPATWHLPGQPWRT